MLMYRKSCLIPISMRNFISWAGSNLDFRIPIFLLNNTALIYILRVNVGGEISSIIACLDTVVKYLYELCSNFYNIFLYV